MKVVGRDEADAIEVKPSSQFLHKRFWFIFLGVFAFSHLLMLTPSMQKHSYFTVYYFYSVPIPFIPVVLLLLALVTALSVAAEGAQFEKIVVSSQGIEVFNRQRHSISGLFCAWDDLKGLREEEKDGSLTFFCRQWVFRSYVYVPFTGKIAQSAEVVHNQEGEAFRFLSDYLRNSAFQSAIQKYADANNSLLQHMKRSQMLN